MNHILITDTYYKKFERNQPRELRERYTKYIHDLYKLYNTNLTESTFSEGGQFTYAEMGEEILEEIKKKHDLSSIDLVVVSYWVHECDPDYAACGPYLSEKFGMSSIIFDICDQGTIAPFSALEIIKSYHRHGNCKKSLLVLFEQTTVPRNKEEYDVIPNINSSLSFVIENITDELLEKKIGYEILSSETVNEGLILNENNFIENFLNSFIEKNLIDPSDVTVAIRKDSYIWKKIKYLQSSNLNSLNIKKFEHYDYSPGCIPPFEYIHNNFKQENKNSTHFIVLSEDVETMGFGCLLLKRNS